MRHTYKSAITSLRTLLLHEQSTGAEEISTAREDQDISDIFNQVERIAAKEEEIQDFNPKRGGPPFFHSSSYFQTTQWS